MDVVFKLLGFYGCLTKRINDVRNMTYTRIHMDSLLFTIYLFIYLFIRTFSVCRLIYYCCCFTQEYLGGNSKNIFHHDIAFVMSRKK